MARTFELRLLFRYYFAMTVSAPAFTVTALWDEEAKVFYSDSDIPGLCVEAASFDVFVEVVEDLAPEVIAANLPGLAGPYAIRIATARTLNLAA